MHNGKVQSVSRRAFGLMGVAAGVVAGSARAQSIAIRRRSREAAT